MKLFLDIDGVMVHANPHRQVEMEDDGFYKFNHKAIDAINSVDHTNIELVLSTSHRFRFNLSQWKHIFNKRGIRFDKVSIINQDLNHKYSRKTEIEKWIADHHINSNDVIIIDDDKSLNALPENLKKRLILTNPYTGLMDSKELKRILSEK
ncbi:HAD domain-containing protein [Elizabethkingia miricola]|uniref:HAD domain-containing protein n=1 Tax=Elizabethkingia miricola TaxID=172045 RepID=UPI002010FB15|nr:HAD domain-containing protein [Elizabethkingia miricola]MCL1678917.1 HAD domain-containing protein [Elizabethkingia miricola]